MASIKEIINLEKYPINDIGSLKYRELTNYARKQLNEDGWLGEKITKKLSNLLLKKIDCKNHIKSNTPSTSI